MDNRPTPHRLLLCFALALVAASSPVGAQTRPLLAAHPNALWRIVHDLCVRDRRLTGLPAPCVEVKLNAGYAVVPDPQFSKQLLLVPTRRVTGIEDRQLLEPGAANYWQDAWKARRLLDDRLGAELPRDTVAMAVNAIAGRSQAQLHIHISCVRPDVRAALRAAAARLDERWSPLVLGGRTWRARAVAGEEFGDTNPFKLLAQAQPSIRAHMGRQTLVVVGAELSERRPGFVLLSRTANPRTGYSGHGEALLDETCGAV